jgi:5-methylcytosine-specific restriction endonuclease McrA
MPHIKEIRRQNGIKVMARVGKLPHYPHNYRRGPANNKWRGGITPVNAAVRNSTEMKKWRLQVFSRDDYTCQMCDKRGGDLHADHIKPFSLFPDLRFDVDNGRTLCIQCHYKYGALVCNGKVTREPVLTKDAARTG